MATQLPNNIDEFQPVLLGTQELLNLYWPQVAPLMDKCVRKAMAGELDSDDIYTKLMNGEAFAFVVARSTPAGPEVKLAIVLEICLYPKLPTLNIVAVSGSHLKYFYDKYWNHLCGWAYMNGARALDAAVSPAMAKVVGEFGFKQLSVNVRASLTGE